MKIKLRDMTLEQWIKWKREYCVENKIKCNDCPLYQVTCANCFTLWIRNKDLYSDKFLDQELEIEE